MHTPSADFIARQVRWAMGRGLPAQVAEDVVFESWERAVQTFDPTRGSFEAYMQAAVRNRCAYWWRSQARWARLVESAPGPPSLDPARAERVAQHQAALLAALSEEERQVFAAWALQKHLGKGQLTAEAAGRSIGLGPREFENAKRRIKDQVHRILERFGWSVADVLDGGDDVEQTG
jgi:DNA-directed RNA polymerase specialized sigma24 family protein